MMANITEASTLLEAFNGVSWIQECVPENIDIKKSTAKQISEAIAQLKSQKKISNVSWKKKKKKKRAF